MRISDWSSDVCSSDLLEGLATLAIAWLVFRENVDRRLLVGAAAILGGALLLSWRGGGPKGGGAGILAIAGSCLAWGIDHNLTRRLRIARAEERRVGKEGVGMCRNRGCPTY